MEKRFLQLIDKTVSNFGAQYRTFGIFGVVNYPLAYFILCYGGSQTNESFISRLIATLLCIPLIFPNSWPIRTKKYLNVYWYVVILYCLPFLGTYNLLQNQVSVEWLMNISLGIFLLILLIDWMVFIVLLSLGILLGYGFFRITGQQLTNPPPFSALFLPGYIYVYAIIIGVFFARNNELMHKEKLQSMKLLAGTIAHEMRTPLLALAAMAQRLKVHLPKIIDGFKESPLSSVHKNSVTLIREIPQDMENTTRGAFNIIDILLMNLREGENNEAIQRCSVNACIEQALEDYYLSLEDKMLIQWERGPDFQFQGNPLLIKHVLFNLLKNALHYVKAANKGCITITTTLNEKGARLYFKDTGKGIPAHRLPYIFERFYSKTAHGTGIGLAFCKRVMEEIGGSITCNAVENEYAEFILNFPQPKG